MLDLLLTLELALASMVKDDSLSEYAKLLLTCHLFEADTLSTAFTLIVIALVHLFYRLLRVLTALFIEV